INDALPPPDNLLLLGKFFSILIIALFLSTLPMLIGITVQLLRGYTFLNIPLYCTVLYLIVLPAGIEMVMFAFILHICINNKFAALAAGIAIWTLFLLANLSGWMDYHLLLYSYTPGYGVSDMDGVGHMLMPVSWFNLYWLLAGSLFIVISYLFYVRGSVTSLKERWQLAKDRFNAKTRLISAVLLIAFIAIACYNYYNVSYLNSYYTENERIEMAATMEKQLKHYQYMPLPTVTGIQLHADIFPVDQRATFKARITLVNRTGVPVTQLLLDGDAVKNYTLTYNGEPLNYTNPLIFKRGKFNFLKSRADSSAYRLYELPKPLMPLDTAVAEINSVKEYTGFGNYVFGTDILKNGTSIGPGLPGLGYDDDEELTDNDERAKFGLPAKKSEFAGANDTSGANFPISGPQSGLLHFDITISTPSNQLAIGPGNLKKSWQENGRNYFEFISNSQGVYSGINIYSARYASLKDSVTINNNKTIGVELLYYPHHNANLQRFMAAYKDGLSYYSKSWGGYPFSEMRLVESSLYNRDISMMAGANAFSENFGWNANFTSPNQGDYCYFSAAMQLAKQWWFTQLIPNHSKGSLVITSGLSKYAALLMMKKKSGQYNVRNFLINELDNYMWGRGRNNITQDPLLTAGRENEQNSKAGIVLYGLEGLIGEDTMNAALKEFYQAFCFKSIPPYAGSKDLYHYLKKHTPDSLQYYLEDTWEKITFYDNKVISASAIPLNNNRYQVNFSISTAKTYEDKKGKEATATMNDYVDIGIFAPDSETASGFIQRKILHTQRYKLGSGVHSFSIIVTGKPALVSIDPCQLLIDKNITDNTKQLL
ncbi:MAG TPA: hypothetical protein VHB48_01670, partial [Chitinophagaceae bacterium]|nr:hypothetical protein [Chitinophagaceae bacterium]